MDPRTIRAAVLADAIGFVSVAGIALFLGIDLVPALVAGLVAGTLFLGLILAASRRAASFDDPTDPTTVREDDRA